MYLIDGVTKNLQKWEERGWIGIANKKFFRAIAAHLRKRGAVTTFQWVKGHGDDEGNIGADELAGQGARKDTADELDLTIPPEFNLTGAQLSKITQKLAYQGILESGREKIKGRRGTTANLDITRYAVKDLADKTPTDATIWHSLRHKDITRSIKTFLWKTMHNSQKIGEYWLRIPDYEQSDRGRTVITATEKRTRCNTSSSNAVPQDSKQSGN